MLDRGTANLDVALGEPTFVENAVPAGFRLVINSFRRELWTLMSSPDGQDAGRSGRGGRAAARLAQQRLGMQPTAVVLEYLCGATNALDLYSTYLTPDQLNEVYAQIEGNFVGLGVELKAQDGGLTIVRVISGSPAEEAGVRPGDRIFAVDGRSTASLSTDQAANLLQGSEGSRVQLTLAGAGQPARQTVVERRVVEVPSVDHVKIVDPQYGVGYFRLTCFQKTTARDLDAALWKLHGEGMRSLVVDVRGNPGGLLVSAVEVADRFVERGVIVSTRGRIAQEDFTYSAHEHAKWQVPLVVVIDQDERQRGGDFRRRRPRPPSRHDCRRAEFRQGLRPRHFPTGRFRLRHSADHGEVLLARRPALQSRRRSTPMSRSAPPRNRWRASPIAMTPC